MPQTEEEVFILFKQATGHDPYDSIDFCVQGRYDFDPSRPVFSRSQEDTEVEVGFTSQEDFTTSYKMVRGQAFASVEGVSQEDVIVLDFRD